MTVMEKTSPITLIMKLCNAGERLRDRQKQTETDRDREGGERKKERWQTERAVAGDCNGKDKSHFNNNETI